ncbi:MAG: RloB family protein [Pseudobdellovibrionaceae bacterium]
MNRRLATKRISRKLLIACEGRRTERDYFSGYGSIRRIPHVSIEFLRHEHTDPLGIVTSLLESWSEKLREGTFSPQMGDQPWAVFDVDEHRNHRPEDFKKAIQLAASNSIYLALSNPSFELWLLKHFKYVSANLDRFKANSDLKKEIADYDKVLTDSQKTLLYSKMSTAVANSQQLETRNQQPEYATDPFYNPSTGVHRLTLLIKEIGDRIQNRNP